MKKNLRVNMFFTLILSLAIFGTSIYAQERNLRTELLVYVLPDSLELPQNEKGMVPIESAGKSIGSKQLHSALVAANASKIGRAFPQWAPKDSIVVRSDGEQVNAPAFHRIFIVTFDSEKAAENAISILSKLPSVKFAERHSEPVFDNDPSYLDGTQWYLNNDGRLGGTVGADINADTAWGIFTGSSAVKIAIIDKGIDLNHPEFSGRVSGDMHTGENHGTLVAGVAAANAMDGEEIRGVDWNAQIISKKISSSNGLYIGDNVVAQKVTDAVAEGANVLNCSWSFESTLNTTLKMAFDYAYQMDRVIVATMGNTGVTQKRYPGGYRNVIAVGATQNNDTRSPFSTMGTHIDVVAPGGVNSDNTNGQNIYTTTIGGGYTFTNGTSFAAPQVAGLASLLKGFNSSLTNDDIRQIIRLTADDRGEPGHDPEYGYGRINAGNALSFIDEPNEVVHGVSYGGTSTKTNLRIWVYTGSNWNLAAGTYLNVDRYKVTKRVNFDVPFCSPPDVWMRERQSACLSAASPNDGYPYAEITNITEAGFDVTYWTYYVRFNSAAQEINRWVPATISNSKIAYTAVGIPNTAGTAGPISGPTTVCSTNTTFTLSNLPDGYPVTWSHSSNLAYVSGQGTASYAVKAMSSSTSGLGWVQATVSGPCGDVELPHEVWVGTPKTPTSITFTPPKPYVGGQGVEAWVTSNNPPLASATYQWDGGSHSLTGSGDWSSIYFYTLNTQYWYSTSFRVSASNTCGLSPEYSQILTVQEQPGGGGGTLPPALQAMEEHLTISPNPSSNFIEVIESIPSGDNQPWELRLLSAQGLVVYNVSAMLPKTISVNRLQQGVYVLHAKKGDHVEQHKIIVK